MDEKLKALKAAFPGTIPVMTALFIVIFTSQWMESENHLPAIIGIVVTGRNRR